MSIYLAEEIERLKARIAELDANVKAMRERIVELERVLRMYPEWFRHNSEGWTSPDTITAPRCLLCGKQKQWGHADDCPRQKVLGERKDG